jgi:hypothetical protein
MPLSAANNNRMSFHARCLMLFVLGINIPHWAEHLVQAIQIWVFGWPREKALGVLGLIWPWMIKEEVLHTFYAIAMLIGLIVLLPGFTSASAKKWWALGLVIQSWHFFEHFLLWYQFNTHMNFWGKAVPTSVLQLWFPRVELHLVYNTIVTVPMIIAMIVYMQRRSRRTTATVVA